MLPGLTTSAELCHGHLDRSDDVEGTEYRHKYRITHRSRVEVSLTAPSHAFVHPMANLMLLTMLQWFNGAGHSGELSWFDPFV